MATKPSSRDLLTALGAAYGHKLRHAPVRDFDHVKRAAYMEGVTFCQDFLQAYLAERDQLEDLALAVEADTLTSPDTSLED